MADDAQAFDADSEKTWSGIVASSRQSIGSLNLYKPSGFQKCIGNGNNLKQRQTRREAD